MEPESARRSVGTRVRSVVAVIAASVLLACGDGDEPVTSGPETTTTTTVVDGPAPADSDRQRLDQARERWAANGPDDYRLSWTKVCFCPPTAYVDTIVGGEVVDHREADGSEALDDPGGKTMEAIFDEIADAIADEPASLTVDYDPDTGAVRSYHVDVEANMIDEEYGIEATVTPLDQALPTDDVALEELTDSHPCGYGFQAGRPDQRVGLFAETRPGVDPSGTVTLPAERWEVTIRFGADLFANWCDDVLEPDEPTPVTTETWPVVAGTLSVTGPEGGEYGPATMEGTGLVAERPDGEQVLLGDITVTNEYYGGAAG